MGRNFISRIRILHRLESRRSNTVLIYFTEAWQLLSGCFLNDRSGVRDVPFPKDYDEIREAHFALFWLRTPYGQDEISSPPYAVSILQTWDNYKPTPIRFSRRSW